MLHRQSSEGLICITQTTHAWVSGQLAQAWGNEQFGSFAPHPEVCLGAEQHDIGWLLWEQSPTLNPETGYPHNFMQLPVLEHVLLWTKAKYLALALGRYPALLVSLHGTGLYQRHRHWENSEDTRQMVEAFLQKEEGFQEGLLQGLKNDPRYVASTTPEVIERNQQLVAIWDLLSLALCMGFGETKEVERVPTATGETSLTLSLQGDESVKISPWPFQGESVKVAFEGRLLRDRSSSEEEMRQALEVAPWVTLTVGLHP